MEGPTGESLAAPWSQQHYIKEKASVIAALQLREKLSSLFRPYGGIDFKFERHPNDFQ